jgi:hypothetical protein
MLAGRGVPAFERIGVSPLCPLVLPSHAQIDRRASARAATARSGRPAAASGRRTKTRSRGGPCASATSRTRGTSSRGCASYRVPQLPAREAARRDASRLPRDARRLPRAGRAHPAARGRRHARALRSPAPRRERAVRGRAGDDARHRPRHVSRS